MIIQFEFQNKINFLNHFHLISSNIAFSIARPPSSFPFSILPYSLKNDLLY